VREATGLSQGAVARKSGVRRQSYAQFESAEEKGAISLASLKRAAEAMDCDLVYYLVPKQGIRDFEELADARDPSAAQRKAAEQSMALGGRATRGEAP
jgi:transcriptional regulator with XRE-family HTH domain